MSVVDDIVRLVCVAFFFSVFPFPSLYLSTLSLLLSLLPPSTLCPLPLSLFLYFCLQEKLKPTLKKIKTIIATNIQCQQAFPDTKTLQTSQDSPKNKQRTREGKRGRRGEGEKEPQISPRAEKRATHVLPSETSVVPMAVMREGQAGRNEVIWKVRCDRAEGSNRQ